MTAMARPGSLQAFAHAISAPQPLGREAAAIALTLCDFQTPIWIAPAFRNDAILRYLRFHTGAPVVEDCGDAAFALLSSDHSVTDFRQFAVGSHEYPDRSATLIIQTQEISDSGPVELSGPGISMTTRLSVKGLEVSFWEALQDNHQRFPLGVDIILSCPGTIAACPRSTRIRIRETV
jgi:alpha-D-ribose 1-methylphosphonate 5-triphosphate synthase subunit PhnH